jgi:DNA-binding HxlR family transcriptional regulator
MANKSKAGTVAGEELLCPVRYSLDIVGGKWKLPILCMLASGEPTRYSTIKRKLGDVTNMMLAQSLKELEAMGMVLREQYNEVPPRVEYSLTEKGSSIVPILVQFGTWGIQNMQNDSACGAKCTTCQATM